MKLDVTFSESNQEFRTEFGEVQNISDGGFERGYAAGYEKGNTEGYTKGHTDGVEQGYANGYDVATQQSKNTIELLLTNNVSEQGYIENDVTSLRSYAFYGTDFKEVRLPNVVTIGSRCFYECRLLENIYMPNLTACSGYDFRYCVKLQKVDLPKVEKIEAYSFAACTVLKALVLRVDKVCSLATSTSLSNTPIESGTGFVYVPDSLVDDYKTATNWSAYADQIKPISELEVVEA